MKDKNCLNCSLFPGCKDPKKSYKYVCDKYQQSGMTKTSSKSSKFFEDEVPINSAIWTPEKSLDLDFGEKELVLSNELDTIFSSNSKVARDVKVDDRDLKEFPNFFEFTLSKEGLDFRLFTRQIMMGIALFAEYCPRCSDRAILPLTRIPIDYPIENLPNHIVMLKNGICPKCKVSRVELIQKKELNWYRGLVACIGQRSGKSRTTAMFANYLVHRYLKLQRPAEVYNLLRGDTLTGTLVSLTFDHCYKFLWNFFHFGITNSPWFLEYQKLLDHFGNKYGEELYRIRDTSIEYKHRSLLIYCSGPNRRTARGATRFMCLTGDTLVDTSSGLKRIGDKNLRGATVFANNSERKVSNWVATGYKPILSLELANGMKLSGSPEHPVMTKEGWKKLGELASDTKGNMVAVSFMVTRWPSSLGLRVKDKIIKMSPAIAGWIADIQIAGIRGNSEFTKKISSGFTKMFELDYSPEGYQEIKDYLIDNSLLVPWCILRADRQSALMYYLKMIDINVSRVGLRRLRELQLLGIKLGIYSEIKQIDSRFVLKETDLESRLSSIDGNRRILYVPVARVSKANPTMCYDIQVDHIDHSFTGNGIITHNSAIDELGLFDNTEGGEEKEKMNAEEVYTSLNNSLKTVRGAATKVMYSEGFDVPNAYDFNISSPMSQTDKIMSLTRSFVNSRDVLAVHLPTWKFNPNLPKSAFAADYQANPLNAERDFGANPPLNPMPFISNASNLAKIGGPSNAFKYTYTSKLGGSGMQERAANLINVRPSSANTILALDAGYSDNSFAMAVGTVEYKPTAGGEKRLFPKVLGMIEIAPVVNESVINHTQLFKQVICPIIERMNTLLVVSDRWQNIKILQDIDDLYGRTRGVKTLPYRMRYADFTMVKGYLLSEDKSMEIPHLEVPPKQIMEMDLSTYPHCFQYKPVAHFYHQCLTVQDHGNTLIKGNGVTDDIFRAVMLLCRQLLDPEVARLLVQNQAGSGHRGGLIAAAGRSTGSYDSPSPGQGMTPGLAIIGDRSANPSSMGTGHPGKSNFDRIREAGKAAQSVVLTIDNTKK